MIQKFFSSMRMDAANKADPSVFFIPLLTGSKDPISLTNHQWRMNPPH